MSKKINILLILGIILIAFGGFMFIKNSVAFKKYMDQKYADNNKNNNNSKKDNLLSKDDIKIKFTIDNVVVKATLKNTETSLELMRKLPLEITMSDLNNKEKYYYFNEAFITDSKVITSIKKGDIMIYSNNCLVLFYKSHKNITYSYTKLGEVDDIKVLDNAIKKGVNQKVIVSLDN